MLRINRPIFVACKQLKNKSYMFKGNLFLNQSVKSQCLVRYASTNSNSDDLSSKFESFPPLDQVDGTLSDISLAASDSVVNVVTPALMNYPSHYIMYYIDYIHNFVGIPYWEAIVLVTIGLRVLLLPVGIKTVINGARMAALRPDMQLLQDTFNKNPNASDHNMKLKLQQEMLSLFKIHKVNPLYAALLPIFQIPLFVTFFLALQNMGTFYPALSTGGILWFTDLTAADPFYILPVLNSLSFLLMVEIGADGMQDENMGNVKWGLRGLAVAMIPLTATMPEVRR